MGIQIDGHGPLLKGDVDHLVSLGGQIDGYGVVFIYVALDGKRVTLDPGEVLEQVMSGEIRGEPMLDPDVIQAHGHILQKDAFLVRYVTLQKRPSRDQGHYRVDDVVLGADQVDIVEKYVLVALKGVSQLELHSEIGRKTIRSGCVRRGRYAWSKLHQDPLQGGLFLIPHHARQVGLFHPGPTLDDRAYPVFVTTGPADEVHGHGGP